jgi:hypothetical protein
MLWVIVVDVPRATTIVSDIWILVHPELMLHWTVNEDVATEPMRLHWATHEADTKVKFVVAVVTETV